MYGNFKKEATTRATTGNAELLISCPLFFLSILNSPGSWHSNVGPTESHTVQVKCPVLQTAGGLESLHILYSCRGKQAQKKTHTSFFPLLYEACQN